VGAAPAAIFCLHLNRTSEPMSMSETTASPAPMPARVTVEALDIPFGRLVLFFIKAALAAVPAMLAVMAILMVIGFLLRAVFGFGHGGGYWHY
jgi:hypothetical protein